MDEGIDRVISMRWRNEPMTNLLCLIKNVTEKKHNLFHVSETRYNGTKEMSSSSDRVKGDDSGCLSNPVDTDPVSRLNYSHPHIPLKNATTDNKPLLMGERGELNPMDIN